SVSPMYGGTITCWRRTSDSRAAAACAAINASPEALHHHRRRLAAAEADAGAAVAPAALGERVQEGDDDARAGGADRVAERHRAAAHVELLGGDLHIAGHRQGDGGEGLVHLEEIDLVDAQAGALERLADGADGRGGEPLGVLRESRLRDQ